MFIILLRIPEKKTCLSFVCYGKIIPAGKNMLENFKNSIGIYFKWALYRCDSLSFTASVVPYKKNRNATIF